MCDKTKKKPYLSTMNVKDTHVQHLSEFAHKHNLVKYLSFLPEHFDFKLHELQEHPDPLVCFSVCGDPDVYKLKFVQSTMEFTHNKLLIVKCHPENWHLVVQYIHGKNEKKLETGCTHIFFCNN